MHLMTAENKGEKNSVPSKRNEARPHSQKKGTIIVKIPSTDSPVNLVNKSEKKK